MGGVNDSLFCGTELAARIESAEAQLIAAGTGAALRRHPELAFVTPVAGGFACFGEDGAPFNKVVGLGFGGVPGETALDEIEAAYAARGALTQVELTNLADPEIGLTLTGRGYRRLANVLGTNVLGTSLKRRPARPARDRSEVRSA